MVDQAMAPVVSYQPLNTEAEVQSQASSCGFCGGQSDTVADFSEYFSFPIIITPLMLCTDSIITDTAQP